MNNYQNTSPNLSRKASQILIVDESQFELVTVHSLVQSTLAFLFKKVNEEIRSNEISAQIPSYSITCSFNLGETQLIPFQFDNEFTDTFEEDEPILPSIDQWRRINAGFIREFKPKPLIKIEEEEESEFIDPGPQWDEFEPEMKQIMSDEEEDLYDQQLRSQLEYREKNKAEYEAQQLEQEKQKQEEKRKIRVLVDGQTERVTYDFDGKVMLKKNKVHLPKLSGRVKGNEQKAPEPPIVEDKTKNQIPKMKYKHKIYKLQPKFEEDPEALKIIEQQEQNVELELMDSLKMAPGVYVEIGEMQKGIRQKQTQAQNLPYQVQQQIGQYLSQEQSIRLSKEEYSNFTLNGSIIQKQGSYEQSYLHKKFNHSKTLKSQTIVEDPIPRDGLVRVNDIGKFYDLLIKDQEVLVDINSSQQNLENLIDSPRQSTHTQNNQDIHQQQPLIKLQVQTKPNKQQKSISNSSSQPELPSIPATQFYRYLQNQSNNNSINTMKQLDNSSVTGSVTSKLTRERSLPGPINNLKMHKFLAAPKIGKYLGFGVNQQYKFKF